MSRRFVAERRRDPYYRAAQREGLRSRAAFKLEYLDRRFHLLAPGRRVLDLGAAPGGWSVVAAERVGRDGSVTAVDLRSLEPIAHVRYVRADVHDPTLADRLGPGAFDLVLSDLAPRISGAYATDHARSVELVRAALDVALRVLVPGGDFAAKVFDGDLVDGLERAIADAFAQARRTKPPASRAASSEVYLLGLGRRPGGAGRGGTVPRASAI